MDSQTEQLFLLESEKKNPVVNMVPGASPAPPPPSTPQKQTTSSGASLTPAPAGPSTPSSPNVDCTLRKRKRAAAPVVDLEEAGSHDSLRVAKLAYYKSGPAYFEEARKYYARLNSENIKMHEEQVFLMVAEIEEDLDDDYSHDSLRAAKLAFYESGAVYFKVARNYYARLNENIKMHVLHDEQVFLAEMGEDLEEGEMDEEYEREGSF